MISQVSQAHLKGFRFPRSIIAYAVWAVHRFALSLRDVEDLLAERGVIVSHDSIRVWCQRFSTRIAARIRRDRPAAADKWHLGEVVISMRGKKHWLWRAVDANGDMLDIGAKLRECPRRQTFPEKTDEALGRAVRSRDRQAAQLWRGGPGPLPRHRPSLAQAVKQPLRDFTQTHAMTRENHGTFQIPAPGAAVSVRPRPDNHSLPPQTPPTFRNLPSPCPG